ncbi:Magnesium-transporting ATPase, P-type 1 [bacterium HR30]|nr:Magnesium-transporting ATPase, P-type 1 [bacterium HR30]
MTELSSGLSSEEARQRLERFGPNEFGGTGRTQVLRQFLARFANPLVSVLLFASAVSAMTGDVAGAGIIATIIVLSVSLDFVQEYRAGRAAEALARRVALTAHVLRDGKVWELPFSAIVPGDVVLLAAGDLVPGDGWLLEGKDIFVDQAALTGEPYPVERHAAPAGTLPQQPQALSPEVPYALFLGSSVVSGTGRMLVLHTGSRTLLGRIAGSLERPAPPTAFEIGTRQFGLLIMRLTVGLVLFVLLVNLLFQRPLLESFLFAVALAVGLTPELLPMIVSVTLARGALRMAKENVIVKRLSAIQDLGAVDVLCTDKTGTLTEAKIRLERHVDIDGNASEHVLELAYLNSFFETGLKSPMDEAILEHREIDASQWRKVDEVPFDFERRRISVLLEREGRRFLLVKGAPEEILPQCKGFETGSGTVQGFDAAVRARATQLFDNLGEDGFRVLAIAWKEVEPARDHASVADETDLVFAGFAAFFDPPKASASLAVQALIDSGVAVKILTGDNERVTRHVCTQLHLPVAGVLTGKEIAAMNDEALRARVEACNIFCRLDPMQKNRVLLALKARGHVVAYLGDGINDAPSLHTADVGISVDSAVDVAKHAADFILLQQDLRVLHAGIREGRRTFGNVMKYIMMATSSNFGNMFSMAGATLFLPFLPMRPLQILLNNLLYDLSEIPLPLDQVDEEDMQKPRKWEMRFVRDFMLSVGPISSVFDFLTFYLLLRLFAADQVLFHTGWFVESVATQVLVIFVLRTRQSPLRSRPHPSLAAAALGVVALAVLLPFSPLAPYLGFRPLPPLFFVVLAAVVLAYLFLVEQVKRSFFRRHVGSGHA